jgi:hypothetical protein
LDGDHPARVTQAFLVGARMFREVDIAATFAARWRRCITPEG